uniref:U3 small nucleolar RNA-associated protein 15 C-terminal domain-containing protein n=1 Tax=Aplanochytrium stocchinoi TaxID=215587 RepID=A0A7S3LNC8_9STRA
MADVALPGPDFKSVDYSRFVVESKKIGRSTPEERYSNTFKPLPRSVDKTTLKDYKLLSAVTSVHFSPSGSRDFCATGGTVVKIFNGQTGELKKTISRFKGIAYSGNIRNDGRLLVAGCENSHISLFDLESGNLLRMFKKHTAAVHVTRWSNNNTNILSCSDDKTARIWDVSTEAQVHCFRGHGDYVRCAVMNPASENMCITGSYDSTVKFWDFRAGKPTIDINHGAPIEALLAIKGGDVVLSAAGNEIKVWDVTAGGKLLRTFSNHQKTITGLQIDGTGTRLLSCSLDAHVKIYDIDTFESVSQKKLEAPILSLDIDRNNTKIIAGLSRGDVVVHSKKPTAKESQESVAAARGTPFPGTFRYFMRGANTKASAGDYKVSLKAKRKLKAYDKSLKEFRYKKALTDALNTRSHHIVIGVLEELLQRAGLEAAIRGRDDATLEPLLSFLIKFLFTPQYASLLVDVCTTVLEIYADHIGGSVLIDELFTKLQKKLKHELKVMKELTQLNGTIEMLLYNNAAYLHS